MPVVMVDIGVVRVLVGGCLVGMQVRMVPAAVERRVTGRMVMVVVQILVVMAVFMHFCGMLMQVAVPLGDHQVEPSHHEGKREEHSCSRDLPKDQK